MNPLTTTSLALLLAGSLIPSGAAAADTPRTWREPTSGIEFVRVEKACYRMGNDTPLPPKADGGWIRLNYSQSLSTNEGPTHEACLDAYWLGRHEVTRKQWRDVMGPLPDGIGPGADNLPVTHVTWHQANDFARRLSELSGKRFRLPTEAEWEFACRGASAAALDRGLPTSPAELAAVAVADIKAPPQLAPVGSRAPNAGGFHDLLGNAWEWTADDYAVDGYKQHALYNPRLASGGESASIRGGSVRTEFIQTRCTMRGHYPKSKTLELIGLRIVRED